MLHLLRSTARDVFRNFLPLTMSVLHETLVKELLLLIGPFAFARKVSGEFTSG